jgi:hypothetical protein
MYINFDLPGDITPIVTRLGLQLIHFMAIKNLQILVIDNVVNFLLLAKLI